MWKYPDVLNNFRMINRSVKISFNPQNPMHLIFWLKTKKKKIVAINNFVYLMQFRVFVNVHFPFSFLLLCAWVKNKWCSTINLLLLKTNFFLLSTWKCATHFENDQAIHKSSDSFGLELAWFDIWSGDCMDGMEISLHQTVTNQA